MSFKIIGWILIVASIASSLIGFFSINYPYPPRNLYDIIFRGEIGHKKPVEGKVDFPIPRSCVIPPSKEDIFKLYSFNDTPECRKIMISKGMNPEFFNSRHITILFRGSPTEEAVARVTFLAEPGKKGIPYKTWLTVCMIVASIGATLIIIGSGRTSKPTNSDSEKTV